MKDIFDDSLVISFQEMVEESLMEFSKGNDLIAFQEKLRGGMNKICVTIQQRLLECVDHHLTSKKSTRKGWVIERRNDEKTILSPFGPVIYRRTYFRNKKN